MLYIQYQKEMKMFNFFFNKKIIIKTDGDECTRKVRRIKRQKKRVKNISLPL